MLFDRYNPRFLAYARRHMGARPGASDAVQETWLAIARRIRRLDDPALFRAWAYRILTNKCMDWGRKMQGQKAISESLKVDASSVISSNVEALDQQLTVNALIRLLPADRQALMSLFYVEGLTVAELASVFGIAQGTVKSRLHSAREGLRQEFERREP